MTPRTTSPAWVTRAKAVGLLGVMLIVAAGLPRPASVWAAPPPASASAPPSASSAAPDPAEEASTRFRRGVALYRDGDFRAALIEFKRAYEIVPSYQVLYNLGQASAELQDYVSALQSFEQYLAEGGAEIEPGRRAEVQAEIEKLRPRVARLVLTVTQDGADILVDDLLRGQSPLEGPLLVSAGRRKVSVSKAGHLPVQRYLDLAGGDELALELSLTPTPSPQPTGSAPSAPNPAQDEADGTNTGLWVSLGLTVALGAATGVVGGLALGANGEYSDELDTFPSSRERIEDGRRKVETLALTADVLAAATGVAAIVTILFAIVGGPEGQEQETPTTEGSAAAIEVDLVPGLGGITLVGRF